MGIRYGFHGPHFAVTSACSTGADAIGTSLELIRADHADVMVAGGTEAAVHPLSIGGFDNLRALSRRNDRPEKASRPFDKDRDGFVLSEGAAVIVLEELGHVAAECRTVGGARGLRRHVRRLAHQRAGS